MWLGVFDCMFGKIRVVRALLSSFLVRVRLLCGSFLLFHLHFPPSDDADDAQQQKYEEEEEGEEEEEEETDR